MFFVARMYDSSMSPLIAPNDIVIATRCFRTASLRSGDLVFVDIPACGGLVPTVRRIQQRTNTPAGQFYFEAANTNADAWTDSRLLGTLPVEDIRGRVIWVGKGN
jgi:hypothetical protein